MHTKPKLRPDQYTDQMRKAFRVLLIDLDPSQQSSRLAADLAYNELRKLLPLARSGELLREAIWIGRRLFDFENEMAARRRDHIIRSAVSKPMAKELAHYEKNGTTTN